MKSGNWKVKLLLLKLNLVNVREVSITGIFKFYYRIPFSNLETAIYYVIVRFNAWLITVKLKLKSSINTMKRTFTVGTEHYTYRIGIIWIIANGVKNLVLRLFNQYCIREVSTGRNSKFHYRIFFSKFEIRILCYY